MTGAIWQRLLRDPISLPLISALVCIVLFEPEAFYGSRTFGGDEVGILYPWYVTAVRTFWVNPTGLYDPYSLGGMPSFNFVANYDPIYAIPVIFGFLPSVAQFQVLALLHGFLIPISLLSIGRARRLPAQAMWCLAALSVCAVYMGPNAKYGADTDGSDCYAWSFAVLAAFEHYRASGRLRYALFATLCVAFATLRFATGAVFLPFVMVPVVALYWRQIANHRNGWRNLAIACAAAITVIVPNLIMQWKLYSTIEASMNVQIVQEASTPDILALLGMRMEDKTFLPLHTIFAVPGVIFVMGVLTLSHIPKAARFVYISLLLALGLYALGDLTPFQNLFRTFYPPAALFRRPYAAIEIVYPLAFVMIAAHLSFTSGLQKKWRSVVIGLELIVITAAVIVYPPAWEINVGLGAITIFATMYFRNNLVLSGAAALQWVALIAIPFAQSGFYPQPRIVSFEGFAKYRTLAAFLPPVHVSAAQAYRIVGIGLPADSGMYASVYRYFTIAPSQGTRVPRLLSVVTGIAESGAAEIGGFFSEHPWVAGSAGMRNMAVRYYFINPQMFPALVPRLLETNPALRRIPLKSYWSVIEDPLYHGFIISYGVNRNAPSTLEGTISWNSMTFRVPKDSESVTIADLFDPWWVARAEDGASLDVKNRNGQLEVITANARGRLVTMHYGSPLFSISVWLALAAYVAVLACFAWSPVRRLLQLKEPSVS